MLLGSRADFAHILRMVTGPGHSARAAPAQMEHKSRDGIAKVHFLFRLTASQRRMPGESGSFCFACRHSSAVCAPDARARRQKSPTLPEAEVNLVITQDSYRQNSEMSKAGSISPVASARGTHNSANNGRREPSNIQRRSDEAESGRGPVASKRSARGDAICSAKIK